LIRLRGLSRVLRRRFEPLARRNVRDMKWKKFFYRELFMRDGVLVCKAPVCDICTDFAHCFGN
jgi:nitrogen fixation protein NifQ